MPRSVQLPRGGCPTHRTPSAAGRSAAWPRTPAGSAPRCATSWGPRGVRLRAAGRWARAAGGRVPGFSGGLRAQRGAGAAWEAGAPRGRGGVARGRHRGRLANPADPSSRPGWRSAGRGVSRNASTSSSLPGAGDAVPGDPGGDRMRFHGGPHAPVEGEDGHRDARRSHGPRRRPPEGSLGPNQRPVTSPGSR